MIPGLQAEKKTIAAAFPSDIFISPRSFSSTIVCGCFHNEYVVLSTAVNVKDFFDSIHRAVRSGWTEQQHHSSALHSQGKA